MTENGSPNVKRGKRGGLSLKERRERWKQRNERYNELAAARNQKRFGVFGVDDKEFRSEVYQFVKGLTSVEDFRSKIGAGKSGQAGAAPAAARAVAATAAPVQSGGWTPSRLRREERVIELGEVMFDWLGRNQSLYANGADLKRALEPSAELRAKGATAALSAMLLDRIKLGHLLERERFVIAEKHVVGPPLQTVDDFKRRLPEFMQDALYWVIRDGERLSGRSRLEIERLAPRLLAILSLFAEGTPSDAMKAQVAEFNNLSVAVARRLKRDFLTPGYPVLRESGLPTEPGSDGSMAAKSK